MDEVFRIWVVLELGSFRRVTLAAAVLGAQL